MPLTPLDLGFPPQFPDWRPGQYQSLERALATDRRFIAQAAPTGFGKSLFAAAYAILSGKRTVIDTSTKALQDQYMRDFSSCGMNELRGRQNYPCEIADNCRDGAHYGCDSQSCSYKGAMANFLSRPLNVTNYACHLSNVIHAVGMGQVDNLILDEAHNAIQEVCAALEIRLHHKNSQEFYAAVGMNPPYRGELAKWREWAKEFNKRLTKYLAGLKASGNLDRATRMILAKGNVLARSTAILATAPDGWIVDEHSSPGETILSPVWPDKLTDKYLFGESSRVVLMSATLVPKTLTLLGIDPDQALYMDHQHTFDAGRCPVYIWANARIDYKSSDGERQEWVARMDQIMQGRADRKGIIHTTSYDNQDYIVRNSWLRDQMIAPRKASELPEALREFKASAPPRTLVSPSVTTGYDFPYDAAEYQIIAKLTFIDKRSPLMKARDESDPEYLPYLTAQNLVQTIGRGMRAPDDRCESFIMDSHIKWFMMPKAKRGYKHLFPSWFLRQVKWTDTVPVPPPALSTQAPWRGGAIQQFVSNQ